MSVYFVLAPTVSAVKIGYTRGCAYHRLSVMQANCPVELELVAEDWDGDKDAEADLHSIFSADRIRGEWFRLSDPLTRHIALMPKPSRPLDGRTKAARNEAARVKADAA